jgi:hypothetical protein
VIIAIKKIDPIMIKTIVVDKLLFLVLWYVVAFFETKVDRPMLWKFYGRICGCVCVCGWVFVRLMVT